MKQGCACMRKNAQILAITSVYFMVQHIYIAI